MSMLVDFLKEHLYNVSVTEHSEPQYTDNVVCIFAGKFQPFHRAHYERYKSLCRMFGKDSVYICTNKTAKTDEKHPFLYNDKIEMMTSLFDIPKSHIMTSRTPTTPSWRDIPVSGSDYAVVMVCGEKDAERYKETSTPHGNKVLEYTDKRPLESCLTTRYYLVLPDTTRGTKDEVSATAVRDAFRTVADEDERKRLFKQYFLKYDDRAYKILSSRLHPDITESFDDYNIDDVFEGGGEGHITHLHNDLALTFEDLQNIIECGLNGDLDVDATEKTDGQPLIMTYKDGQFLFGYKSAKHLMPLDELCEKELMRDLSRRVFKRFGERAMEAFANVKNLKSILKNGERQIHLEILCSEMPNSVPYFRNSLVIHYIVEVNDKGKITYRDTEGVKQFMPYIDNTGKDIEVIGPPLIRLKDLDYSSIKNKLNGQLLSIIKKHGFEYTDSITTALTKSVKQMLVDNGCNTLAGNDRYCGALLNTILGKKDIPKMKVAGADSEREILSNIFDKVADGVFDCYDEIKVAISRIGTEIMLNLQNNLCVDFKKGQEMLQKRLKNGVKELTDNGMINTLQRELSRLQALGLENLIPSEGMVFTYKGRLYKITGAFADYIKLTKILRYRQKQGENIDY